MSHLLTFGLGPAALPAPPAGDDLKQVIVAALKGEPALAEILGDNVFPNYIPQTVAPGSNALCYRFGDADHVMHLGGAAGLAWYRVEFEAWSPSAGVNERVREAIRNLFQGLQATYGTVFICFTVLEEEADEYAEPPPGSDRGTLVKRFSLRFKIREPFPTLT